MKIGLIADIHANLYGLRAVLAKLKAVDRIYCAGDITGYYTFINEVFDELQKYHVKFIRGNHDNYLVDNVKSPQSALLTQSVEYARSHISQKNLDILLQTPETRSLTLENHKVKIFHGSPWKMEYIYPDFSNYEKFSSIDADVIILGHTHLPMVKRVGKKLIINPGSCGQSRDGNPEASYAIFDTQKNTAKIFRVAYDTEPVKQAIINNHLNPRLAKILERHSI